MARRKKNPSVLGVVIGLAAVGGLGYLAYKKVEDDKAKKAAKAKKKADEIDEEGAINIEKSMPTSADFPMGWTVEDAGMEANDTGILVHRVLKLNGPSDKCSPDPCTYVLVSVGERSDGSASTSGWGAHQTRDGAYDQLVRHIDSMTK